LCLIALEDLILKFQDENDFELYFSLDEEVITENIIKFFNFIFKTKKEDILKVADIYVRTGELTSEKSENKQKDNSSTTIPTYSQIKSKILQFFPKDENGEIIDIEGVFEVLEKTANKYNDEKIKELYYYDEATGKFEWSV